MLSETIWTVDLEGWLHDGREAREGFYGNDFPAASAVEISSLSSPDLLVEVEIIAVAP